MKQKKAPPILIGGAFFHAGIHALKRLLNRPEESCPVGFSHPDEQHRVNLQG
jgi:hypothetical protein